MVNVLDVPEQVTPFAVFCGVMVIVRVTGVVPLLSAVNDGICV
jgi:hypothetical protein